MNNFASRYAKGIVLIAGAGTSYITAYYGTQHWAPLAIQGIAAVVAILVPNSEAPPKVTP